MLSFLTEIIGLLSHAHPTCILAHCKLGDISDPVVRHSTKFLISQDGGHFGSSLKSENPDKEPNSGGRQLKQCYGA